MRINAQRVPPESLQIETEVRDGIIVLRQTKPDADTGQSIAFYQMHLTREQAVRAGLELISRARDLQLMNDINAFKRQSKEEKSSC